MKQLRFYLDPATGQPHVYNHNVDETEVHEVLSKPIREGPSRDGTRAAVGRTSGGRYLKVIFSPDEDGMGFFVITAYDLKGKALAALRRHLRRK